MLEFLLVVAFLFFALVVTSVCIEGPAPKREYKPSPWHFGVGRHIVAYREGKGYYRVDTEE